MRIIMEGLINPSFRRMPESALLIFLDSRFRGNDDCGINQWFPSNVNPYFAGTQARSR